MSENLYAYAGKILRVNLSNGHIYTEPTSKYIDDWLGSTGIAIKILYDELHPWVTPYDPMNKLIFGAGALLGTPAIGANKMSVSTLGPVTGGWASGLSDSYVGLHLKYAGYDLLVIEGKARTPVYLWIEDEQVEIRDASHLWGKTTWETLEAIREELKDPDLHTVSIGPAGENLVRGACIIQDKNRAFGRCGCGAVMGSKNLKMITAKGSHSIKVAQPERFMTAVKEYHELFKGSKLREYGTLNCYGRKQDISGNNWKNFQESSIPDHLFEKMDPRVTVKKYEIGPESFPGCGVGGCGRRLHVTDGPYTGLKTTSNQWETFSTIQTRLAIEEPTFMFQANSLCNQLGLDVNLVGGAIGWAMECFQRGIITEKDTGGLKLEWGNAELALDLTRKIAYREGFGNILAEGSARAAKIIGRDSDYYAMHIKGQDLYEVLRGSVGWCLGTTTSTRGGGHTTGALITETFPNDDKEKAREVFAVDLEDPLDPLAYEGKAELVKYMEVFHRINNSLGVCHYNTISVDLNFLNLPHIAEFYSAAIGREVTVDDFEEIAMRQLNLEKAFNLRFTDLARADDLPTPRDLSEPIPTGKLKGWKIDKAAYDRLLNEYYALHGWDKETSYPTRETLVKYGLGYVADDLEKIGKLGK